MATYLFNTAWDFTDGRNGTVISSATFETASDEEAIARAQSHPGPNLPVTLRTMLLTTGDRQRVVWMA